MDCKTVEQYLHEHIPLSQAMAIAVISINDDGVVLSAPLAPNINHRGTAFGGSISTVAILAAWTFVDVQLRGRSLSHRIVIRRHHIDYLKPIEGDFQAHCLPPTPASLDQFITTLSKRGKSRITLDVNLYSETALAGQFQGEYVALEIIK